MRIKMTKRMRREGQVFREAEVNWRRVFGLI